MVEQIDRLLQEGQYVAAVEVDYRFHALIREAAAAPELSRVIGSIRETQRRMPNRDQWLRIPGLAEASQRSHRELLRAFQAHDVSAAEAIARDHWLNAGKAVVAYLNSVGQHGPTSTASAPKQ